MGIFPGIFDANVSENQLWMHCEHRLEIFSGKDTSVSATASTRMYSFINSWPFVPVQLSAHHSTPAFSSLDQWKPWGFSTCLVMYLPRHLGLLCKGATALLIDIQHGQAEQAKERSTKPGRNKNLSILSSYSKCLWISSSGPIPAPEGMPVQSREWIRCVRGRLLPCHLSEASF